MLKKLLVFAITSGLAAKLYKSYVRKQDSHTSRTPSGGAANGTQRNNPVPKTQA